MTDSQLRALVIDTFHWADAELKDALLTVPYSEDADAYQLACRKAVQPYLDRLRAEASAARAEANRLAAQCAQSNREWELFLLMRVSETLQ